MEIRKLASGDLEMSMNLDELAAIGQCLNEVCHGLKVRDFAKRVGAEKPYVVMLLDQIVALYPGTLKG